MSLSILPAVPTQDLTITDDGHQFFLTLVIAASSAPCPHCAQISARLHMTCSRQVDDLPWSDAAVSVEWVVPKFSVITPTARKAFSVRG